MSTLGMRYWIMLITLAMPGCIHAQNRSLTSIGILTGYDYCRIPDYHLSGTELKHQSQHNQTSIGVTAFHTFDRWIAGGTFTYLPGDWTAMDSVNFDEGGHSIKIELGYLLSRSEQLRVFPMIGLGKWNYNQQLRRNNDEMSVITTHRFNSLIIDFSINTCFIALPHEQAEEPHLTSVIGFKVGVNAGASMKRMTSSNFDPWQPGIQSIYFQLMISGFAWRE